MWNGNAPRKACKNVGISILMLLLGACSRGQSLSPDDDGSQIELSRGEQVELVLPGNPSTGYMWVVADASLVLEVMGEPEFQPESDLVGAPGEFHFRFEAREPGTAQLLLTYERPFEGSEPLDTFEVEVTVS